MLRSLLLWRVPILQVGHNSVELAMEWLISHPEEAAPAAVAAPAGAAATDEALERNLASSLERGMAEAADQQQVINM
jgi:hypothetical protein